MIIRRRTDTNDGRESWTVESWLAETNKPLHLRFLTSAIELGVDPFRECVGGINPDGTPASEGACDRYPLIGDSQCSECKRGVCSLCRRDNPTPFPHGRTVCKECRDSIRNMFGDECK
jgi:hypothetical protein